MGRLCIINNTEIAESTAIIRESTARLEKEKAESICQRSVINFESIKFRYRT